MKKKFSTKEICDKICELEAYVEFLENRLKYNFNPFSRKQDQNKLYESKKALTNLKSKL